jgi:hypothetical protein
VIDMSKEKSFLKNSYLNQDDSSSLLEGTALNPQFSMVDHVTTVPTETYTGDSVNENKQIEEANYEIASNEIGQSNENL